MKNEWPKWRKTISKVEKSPKWRKYAQKNERYIWNNARQTQRQNIKAIGMSETIKNWIPGAHHTPNFIYGRVCSDLRLRY